MKLTKTEEGRLRSRPRNSVEMARICQDILNRVWCSRKRALARLDVVAEVIVRIRDFLETK